MIYDLSKALDKRRFKERVNTLYKQGKTIELTEKRQKRSLQQNSYLHLCLSWFAIETGNQLDFVKLEYFKKLCNKDLFVSFKDDPYLGRVAIIKSSSDLDTEQMTTAIERFRNWSSQTAGIYLPEPNEQEFLNEIGREVERNKRYL